MDDAPDDERCVQFSDYILSTYAAPDATFPPTLWANHDLDEDPDKLSIVISGISKPFSTWTREYARHYYPHLGHRTYRVPPVDFNTQELRDVTRLGFSELTEPKEENRKKDRSQADVAIMMEDLGKRLEATSDGGGGLFIIANAHYDNYLSDLKGVKVKGKQPPLPREVTARGEVDLLVLHAQKGILLVQVKGVGWVTENWQPTEDELYQAVRRKAKEACKQVKRDHVVLDHVMSDLQLQCAVHRVVALPFVSREMLRQSFNGTEDELDKSGTTFLCTEDLADTDAMLTWWQHLPRDDSCQDLRDDQLQSIVGSEKDSSTSCPSTSSSGATSPAISASEESDHTNAFDLQVPGCAGTSGADLSLPENPQTADPKSVTDSFQSSSSPPHIFRVDFDLDKETAVDDLMQVIRRQVRPGIPCHFLCDEFYWKAKLIPVIEVIKREFPESCIWCAEIGGEGAPKDFVLIPLKTVLRCPPTVQAILQRTDWSAENRALYTVDSTQHGLPTDGLKPRILEHKNHQADSPLDCQECADLFLEFLRHDLKFSWPEKDEESLERKGDDLSSDTCAVSGSTWGSALENGKDASGINTGVAEPQGSKNTKTGGKAKDAAQEKTSSPSGPPVPKTKKKGHMLPRRVKFSDIVVLFAYPRKCMNPGSDLLLVRAQLQDLHHAAIQSSVFYRRVVESGVPSTFLAPNADARDIALPDQDHVIFSLTNAVTGLERKVVVYIPCESTAFPEYPLDLSQLSMPQTGAGEKATESQEGVTKTKGQQHARQPNPARMSKDKVGESCLTSSAAESLRLQTDVIPETQQHENNQQESVRQDKPLAGSADIQDDGRTIEKVIQTKETRIRNDQKQVEPPRKTQTGKNGMCSNNVPEKIVGGSESHQTNSKKSTPVPLHLDFSSCVNGELPHSSHPTQSPSDLVETCPDTSTVLTHDLLNGETDSLSQGNEDTDVSSRLTQKWKAGVSEEDWEKINERVVRQNKFGIFYAASRCLSLKPRQFLFIWTSPAAATGNYRIVSGAIVELQLNTSQLLNPFASSSPERYCKKFSRDGHIMVAIRLSWFLVILSSGVRGELLVNGGFESTDGWDCYNFQCTLSSDSHSGQHSLEHEYSGPAQIFTVEAGHTYTVSGWIKLLNDQPGDVSSKVMMFLEFRYTDHTRSYMSAASHPPIKMADGWVHLVGEFLVPSDKPIERTRIYYQGPAPSVNFLVDDASVTELVMPTLNGDWRKDTDHVIDQLRKSAIHVRVTAAHGVDLNDVEIQLLQTRKSFPFGSAMNAGKYDDPTMGKYRDFAHKHFNWAVPENSLKWQHIEPHKAEGARPQPGVVSGQARAGLGEGHVRGHAASRGPAPHRVDHESDTRPAYLQQAQKFKAANVGVYGIGVQCHFHAQPNPLLIK
ncbi:hypothetical protein BaRGS_00031014, partial [Batillaria attramentaria]